MSRALLSCLTFAAAAAGHSRTFGGTGAGATLTFEKDIRPILRAHCFDCHGSQNVRKGNLDLRLRRLIVAGGDSGPAIAPGQPAESYLLLRLKAGEMPPGEHKVPTKEIALVEAWIAAGAPTARDEPAQIGSGEVITPEDREFWSFRPLRRPKVPSFGPADRVRTPIDAFLLEAMRGKGLSFSADADRRTLIRRLALDLIGLPPQPREVAEFAADPSPNAYEKLVDRLLASPAYGERWGRHWLDVAGYADSEGYDDQDLSRPEAFRYRDYVIGAFNSNKPFDRFVIEQLAGDELVSRPYQDLSTEAIEKLAATGFLRMAADGTATAGSNLSAASNQVVADTIKIVSTSLLGLSVGCAQCHDHRYDPIPQADYYRLRAVFEPALDWKHWQTPAARRVSLLTDADRAKIAAVNAEVGKASAAYAEKERRFLNRALDKELAKFDAALARKLRTAHDTPEAQRTPEQKTLLSRYPSVNISPGLLSQYDAPAAEELKRDADKIAAIRARAPAEEFLRVLTEVPGQTPPTFLFYRGDFQQPRQTVSPGDLAVSAPAGENTDIPQHDRGLATTGRRLAYARRLMSGTHPLVGRVLVNRFWLHHFGRGIVGTPADFGQMGEKPTHPALLDWLACEFASNGWNLKRLHRLMVTSTAYRQTSRRSAPGDAADPDNRLLSRMNVRRLDAEIIRDSMLAASGVQYARMYGPAVPVREDAVGQIVVGVDTKVGANEPGAEVPMGAEAFRRSVYIEVKRSRPLAILRTFDAPVMETNCDRRVASTAAPQALMLMNSDFALSQAYAFAKRVRREAGPRLRDQVQQAYEIAYGRPADERESGAAVEFLRFQSQEVKSHPRARAANDRSRPSRPNRRLRRQYVKQTKVAEPDLQPLTDFCQALLSSNEFLYSD